jgi:hypothetical protein
MNHKLSSEFFGVLIDMDGHSLQNQQPNVLGLEANGTVQGPRSQGRCEEGASLGGVLYHNGVWVGDGFHPLTVVFIDNAIYGEFGGFQGVRRQFAVWSWPEGARSILVDYMLAFVLKEAIMMESRGPVLYSSRVDRRDANANVWLFLVVCFLLHVV